MNIARESFHREILLTGVERSYVRHGDGILKRSISEVYSLYDEALSLTRERLEERLVEGTEELESFYDEFFSSQVIPYGENFKNEALRREIHRSLRERHRTDSLRFWAIDGACKQIETADLAIFYGGAYVVKGELGLKADPPELEYRESEPEDDSSLVAYLPLSPEDLTMLDAEDRFVFSDSDRLTISGLDTALMLLAELYLCYRGASGLDNPGLILWDHSLSSVLANAAPNVRDLSFPGLDLAGEKVWYPDLLVGYSKPWNESLDVPTKKAHGLWRRLVRDLYASREPVDVSTFAEEVGLGEDVVLDQAKLLWECDKYGQRHEGSNPPSALVERDGQDLRLNPDYQNAPAKVQRLFETFCEQFFQEKDPSVLLYEYEDEQGQMRESFLTHDQMAFLQSIGLRLTFERCWDNRIMFVGVVKDSASSYFTKNYLGVMRAIGEFDFEPRRIPATDRLVFERVPYLKPGLEGPWSSPEFDAVFMTLRMRRQGPGMEPELQGVRGNVLLPPNLIMRSLAQFHLKPGEEARSTMGHVVFVDRLVHPDAQPPDRAPVVEGDRDLGTVRPFFHPGNDVTNPQQEETIYLLETLTRNVFPDVIGYPDPLHHADRGAKSVLRTVEPMLKSSERLGRANPIHKTLRQIRDG